MPLIKNAKPGSKGFGKNIATEEKAGKKPSQAIAIAFSEAGEKRKPKKGKQKLKKKVKVAQETTTRTIKKNQSTKAKKLESKMKENTCTPKTVERAARNELIS